ncbi:MAG: efflux RND transporter permease subunit [Myxococcota bacterium]
MSQERIEERKGPIAWMTQNHVAANLLMIVLIAGGIATAGQVKQEVFPEFQLDFVIVTVPYPGASPEEVEQGILLAVEEETQSIDGVKRVTAAAGEGAGSVVIELASGVDANKSLNDVKSAVDRITSFPEEAERPQISLLSNRREVISLALYGEQTEHVLKELAERIRLELLQSPDITYVELSGVKEREIAVEVPQVELRRYGLTLPMVADIIRRTALELPAGGVKTESGEVLVRTAERRDFGAQFESIPVVTTADGTVVRLGELARVRDDFADVDLFAEFDGQPAVVIRAFRSGNETPISVSDAVNDYISENEAYLPPGLSLVVLNDQSVMYRERVDLLRRNAMVGLLLVLIVLAVFLEARLAFWVTMGIPISFLGSLILLPGLDVSINMISLFAFIITLGIVVDDAIVVGENVYEMRQRGMSRMEAAVEGARRISMPVVFSVLTTVAAFMPLLLVPGASGKFFRVIPAIVVAVLLISLVESLFVLPAHLGHRGHFIAGLKRFFLYPFSARARTEVVEREDGGEERPEGGLLRLLNAPQRAFSHRLQRFIDQVYTPVVKVCTEQRYLTIATGVAILFATFGFLASGRLAFTFLPKVDTDVVTAKAVLPYGSPVEAGVQVRDQLDQAGRRVLERMGGAENAKGIYSLVGSSLNTATGPGVFIESSGGHLANVQVFLESSESRGYAASRFAQLWREEVGELPGLEALTFIYSTGPGGDSAIEVQLSHPSIAILEEAAERLADELRSYPGVKDINDGFAAGKPQLDFQLRPEARTLGLTVDDLARQVRSAFYGAEALRQQRGRDEIKVMVRRPESERKSEFDVESLMLTTPGGGEMPLAVAAEVERGRAYTSIDRAEGQRVITVKADVDAGTNAQQVLSVLSAGVIPEIVGDYRGMSVSFEGDSRRQAESLDSLKQNYVLALFVIFALLAIPFRSYVQPAVVMSAIPFGIVGAAGGHLIMGYDLSLISVFGIVALSGIVVNDSLVLVHAANEFRDGGMSPAQAVQAAGARRLRPILLTSLTTFFGLAPMIFETSVQARFLIPMAISLGFGVLFATFVILLIVPALYLVVEDLGSLLYGERASAESAQTGSLPEAR